MSYSTPTKHDGRAVLFAVAELLVTLRIEIFDLFGPVTLTLTQWPSYTNLTCIPRRYIGCANKPLWKFIVHSSFAHPKVIVWQTYICRQMWLKLIAYHATSRIGQNAPRRNGSWIEFNLRQWIWTNLHKLVVHFWGLGVNHIHSMHFRGPRSTAECRQIFPRRLNFWTFIVGLNVSTTKKGRPLFLGGGVHPAKNPRENPGNVYEKRAPALRRYGTPEWLIRPCIGYSWC